MAFRLDSLKNPWAARSLRRGMALTFGFGVLAKGIGYFRQLIIANYFGLSRNLDIYFMAQGITMMLLFAPTTWFDRLAVPHLVRRKERDGVDAFHTLAASLFTVSWVMAGGLAILFIVLIYPASRLLSHGFTAIEQDQLCHVMLYFVPWILVIFPYSALTAILKSVRLYDAVVIADFTVSVVSTAGFFLWHMKLTTLPLTLSLGYLVSLVMLLIWTPVKGMLWGPIWTSSARSVYRNFIEMFFASHANYLQGGIGRFFQSYLRPGSISAYAYAIQTLAPFQEVLGFDELFVVPLSSSEGRLDKLHRLLSGCLLLSIPVAVFLAKEADSIISVLYQRGQFDAQGVHVTALVFAVAAFGLISGAIETPLVRMLQITDHVLHTGVMNIVSSILVLGLNAVFIFRWKLDVLGITIAMVAASCSYVVTAIFFLHRTGISIDLLRLSKYALWAGIISALGIYILQWAPLVHSAFFNLASQGCFFGAIVVLGYIPVRKQVRFILYG